MIRDRRWPVNVHDDGSICTKVVPKPEQWADPQQVIIMLLMMQWANDADERLTNALSQQQKTRARRRR